MDHPMKLLKVSVLALTSLLPIREIWEALLVAYINWPLDFKLLLISRHGRKVLLEMPFAGLSGHVQKGDFFAENGENFAKKLFLENCHCLR